MQGASNADRSLSFQLYIGKVDAIKREGEKKLRGGRAKERIQLILRSNKDPKSVLTSDDFKISGRIYRGGSIPSKYIKAKLNPNDTAEVLLSIKSLSKRLRVDKKELLAQRGNLSAFIETRLKEQLKEPVVTSKPLATAEREKNELLGKINAIRMTPSKIEKYKNDEAFMLKLGKGNQNLLQLAGDKLKKDSDFVVKALKLWPGYPIPEDLENNLKIQEQRTANIANNPSLNLRFGSQAEVLNHIKRRPLDLEFASDTMRANKDIATEAVQIKPEALQYVNFKGMSPDDVNSIIAANSEIKESPRLYQYAPRVWLIQHLEDAVIPALKNPDFHDTYPEIRSKVEDKLTETQKLDISKANSKFFEFYIGEYDKLNVKYPAAGDKFILEALKRDGTLIKCLDDWYLKAHPDCAREAVKQNPQALRHFNLEAITAIPESERKQLVNSAREKLRRA